MPCSLSWTDLYLNHGLEPRAVVAAVAVGVARVLPVAGIPLQSREVVGQTGSLFHLMNPLEGLCDHCVSEPCRGHGRPTRPLTGLHTVAFPAFPIVVMFCGRQGEDCLEDENLPKSICHWM